MCTNIAISYYTFVYNFTILICFNLIKRLFVKITDKSTNNIKNKKKTFANNEFSTTTSRDIIKINNIKQQFFISTTKKSQSRIEIVVSSVEIITIDVNNTVNYETLVVTKKKKLNNC